jgi:hypothetical protein
MRVPLSHIQFDLEFGRLRIWVHHLEGHDILQDLKKENFVMRFAHANEIQLGRTHPSFIRSNTESPD